jgi:drug/metabolite transporter (DMT)-like permease
MFNFKFLALEYKGCIYAILSGFCYGFLGYFGVNLIDSGLSICNMLCWRFIISSILLGLMLCIKTSVIEKSYLPIIRLFFSGAFFYALCTIIYFFSSHYIGTGPAMVIFFTYPAIVIILNRLIFGIVVGTSSYIAFILLIVGIMCLADLDTLNFDFLGMSLGLVSAVFYAAYMVATARIKLSPLLSSFLVSLGCAFTCFVWAYLEGSFTFPEGSFVWLNLISLGIIATAVPILLLLESMQYISSERASMLSVLEPVFVVIFGVLLLGESLTVIQVFGIIIILSGALISIRRS